MTQGWLLQPVALPVLLEPPRTELIEEVVLRMMLPPAPVAILFSWQVGSCTKVKLPERKKS